MILKSLTAGLLALGVTGGAAAAAPTLTIRQAAVHVVIIPEDRPDVSVTVLSTNPKLPLYITKEGNSVLVDGRLWLMISNCHDEGPDMRVSILGKGDFTAKDLPQIVVHAPLDVLVSDGGMTIGSIGRASSVQLHHSGCGGWTVANVEHELSLHHSGSGRINAGTSGSADIVLSGVGQLRIGAVKNTLAARVSGSGLIQAQAAGAADLTISGSGDVRSGPVTSGLEATISGSGNLDIARLDGPLKARVSGVGQVRVPQGSVTDMQARISGSGGIDFGGVARTLDAEVSGSGDVRAGEVTGQVNKHVSGSGEVRIGR